MRRFVVFLAAFGLALLVLLGVALLYFRGQIPPVAVTAPRFVLRADSGVSVALVRSELETATARFVRLLGAPRSGFPLTVAYIDDAKQMTAVTLYLALRQSIGTPPEHLFLPFPTPRLAALLAREPGATSGVVRGQQGLGHEVGHWLLRLYLRGLGEKAVSDTGAVRTLPPWLREGIAGYCESDEGRIAALLRVRQALADSTRSGILDLDRLLGEAPPGARSEDATPGHFTPAGAADAAFEFYYDETMLLVCYLEARHPGTVAKLVQQPDFLGRPFDAALLHDRDAFRTWIETAPPLSL
jgi:hypothetical protein